MKDYKLFILLILLLTYSIGCATLPKEANSDEALRSKANTYWKLRIEGQYDKTYDIEYPEGLVSFKDYLVKAGAIKKFHITSFSIKKVHIEGNKGFVDVEFKVLLPNSSKPIPMINKDEWIYKDGIWYHISK